MRSLGEARNGCVNVQTRLFFWGEKRSMGKSIGYEVRFTGHPTHLERIHSDLLTKTLETWTGQVKNVILKNTLQGPVIRVDAEER